ncbi:hypothetical protein FA13DRAFT_1742736 [Coprinellus micaceus]|uniref:F-box domain-containing protein n=1 Tax=Coprinellus micaceus TaxID=71717 RepID=A0A4Y7SFK3_COPMI|nr:hypothetical protein FA13DRAFT_1742736 [Coprinellus micaceus]
MYGLHIAGQKTALCLKALMRGLQDSASPSWSSIQRLDWQITGEYCDMLGTIRTFPPTLATLPPSLSSLSLSITLPSDRHAQATRMIAPTILNRLKWLDIHFLKDFSPMASLLEHCISLRHLSIRQSGGEGYWVAPEVLEKDGQLFLGRNPINVGIFLRVLRAPNLKTIRTRQDRTIKPEERYLWNSLHSLHLFTPSENRPAVQHLTLFARSTPAATIPANELYDILSDLPPPLSHLRLENLTFDAGELLEIHQARATSMTALRLSPSLQRLEIANPGPKFDLVSFLDLVKGVHGTPPVLGAFPALRRIVFTFSLFRGWETYPDNLFLPSYRDEATLRELEASFGIVMDLIVLNARD